VQLAAFDPQRWRARRDEWQQVVFPSEDRRESEARAATFTMAPSAVPSAGLEPAHTAPEADMGRP